MKSVTLYIVKYELTRNRTELISTSVLRNQDIALGITYSERPRP